MAAMITDEFQYCLILILLYFVAFLCIFIFKKPKNDVNLPPSAPSLPIIGHLHHLLFFLPRKPSFFFFDFLPHKCLHTLSSKYGPLLFLRIVCFPTLLVSSASVAYEIFTDHDVNISSRNISFKEGSFIFNFSGFVFAPYDEYFKFMKKLIVTNLLGPNAQVQSRSIRADELERLHKNLLDKARKKESIKIHKEARNLVGNIIARMTIGRSFTEENGELESIQGLVAKATGSKMKTVLLGRLIFGLLEKLGIQRFKDRLLFPKLDELLEMFLVEHKEKPNKDGCTDMMDVLLAVSEDENAEYRITREHIKVFFVELFFGNIDSSVSSIQWAMAEIINNHIIIERLKEEIDSVVGTSRLIQETDLPNLPYLQAVIKETLRLHPPVPLIPREFKRGCTVGGFSVPERTKLIVNVYAVMRDPNVWEDPLKFKPERFLTSLSSKQDERKTQALKYLPFGGGRRGCPGSNLGYTIVGTTIGMMVQCFDWRIKGEKVNMDEFYQEFHQTMAHPLTLTPVTRISTLGLETSLNLQT